MKFCERHEKKNYANDVINIWPEWIEKVTVIPYPGYGILIRQKPEFIDSYHFHKLLVVESMT